MGDIGHNMVWEITDRIILVVKLWEGRLLELCGLDAMLTT